MKLATSDLACSWGWPRPSIKTATKEKVGVALGSSKIFGVPFDISATAALSSWH